MPRTSDPTGLSRAERLAFRKVVRSACNAAGLTYNVIGDALEQIGRAPDEKGYAQVRNAMQPNRGSTETLLAKTAFAILEGLYAALSASSESGAFAARVDDLISEESPWSWVRAHLARVALPGALLIEADIDRLAAIAAGYVMRLPGMNSRDSKTARAVTSKIAAALRENSDAFAAAWLAQAAPYISRLSPLSESSRASAIAHPAVMLVRATHARLNKRPHSLPTTERKKGPKMK